MTAERPTAIPGAARPVGIGEMVVSGDRSDVLVTYALGSCVGLSLYDPVLRIGGLIHCMLPLSSANTETSPKSPLMFTDTGVAALLRGLFDAGCRREHLVAKVAGAASNLDEGGLFRIGERNYAVLRRVLWKNDVLIAGEAIGGAEARTLTLEIATGRTCVRARGTEIEI